MTDKTDNPDTTDDATPIGADVAQRIEDAIEELTQEKNITAAVDVHTPGDVEIARAAVHKRAAAFRQARLNAGGLSPIDELRGDAHKLFTRIIEQVPNAHEALTFVLDAHEALTFVLDEIDLRSIGE